MIGSFDVVLRTNLNGRQPRWTLTIIRDTGPPLQFLRLQIDCRESVDVLPDNDCGSVDLGGPLVSGRWTSGLRYGPRLANSNEYYAVVNGEFAPEGRPAQVLGALQSKTFNCFGVRSNCYFP